MLTLAGWQHNYSSVIAIVIVKLVQVTNATAITLEGGAETAISACSCVAFDVVPGQIVITIN